MQAKTAEKQSQRISVVMENNSQDVEKSKQPCCEQCNIPVPLVCWRSKMRQHLDYLKIRTTDKDAFFQQTD